MAEFTLLTGYEPNLTTSTTRRLLKSSSGTNPATRCPRACLTRNSTMRPSVRRSLHHCSFRSEKNQRTEDKLITRLKKFVASSVLFCVSLKNGETVHELSSLSSCSREKPSRGSENERIRILFERQKEQILANFRAEIQTHEFQADSVRN